MIKLYIQRSTDSEADAVHETKKGGKKAHTQKNGTTIKELGEEKKKRKQHLRLTWKLRTKMQSKISVI